MSKKHSHYFKDVSGLQQIDVYTVLALFEVDNHAIGHAIKKLLCAGKRGAKDLLKDYGEAIDSINRAAEMLGGAPGTPVAEVTQTISAVTPLGVGKDRIDLHMVATSPDPAVRSDDVVYTPNTNEVHRFYDGRKLLVYAGSLVHLDKDHFARTIVGKFDDLTAGSIERIHPVESTYITEKDEVHRHRDGRKVLVSLGSVIKLDEDGFVRFVLGKVEDLHTSPVMNVIADKFSITSESKTEAEFQLDQNAASCLKVGSTGRVEGILTEREARQKTDEDFAKITSSLAKFISGVSNRTAAQEAAITSLSARIDNLADLVLAESKVTPEKRRKQKPVSVNGKAELAKRKRAVRRPRPL